MEPPACEATIVTVPAPVNVTVDPETDAGPAETLYVTGNPDDDVAFSGNAGSPYVRFAIGGKAMVCDCATTLIVKLRLPGPMPLVAVIVAVVLPMVVGVPDMTPVAVFTLSPLGSPLAPKVVGEYDAVI